MLNRIPEYLFAFAVMVALVGYGVAIGKYEVFPYEILFAGQKTGQVLLENIDKKDLGTFQGFADVKPQHAASKRIELIASDRLINPVLFYGGRFQFSDFCPGGGCLAVEYSTTGEMTHAYPYRPDEIFAANITDEFPYESTGFVFSRDVRPVGISRYRNGDLLVIFQNSNTFPYGGGVARVDRDGHPVWFRRDYSHHWPTFLEDDVALVPGLTIGKQSLVVELIGKRIKLKCETEKPYMDEIRVLDGNGKLLKRIPLVESILKSPFKAVLQHTTDHCDPLHLNYIGKLPKSAGGSDGVVPGAFVVSLRNLSAFAIVDGKDGHFKRLIRGTFFQQHSVKHLDAAKFLMFDNHGGDANGGPSRLLMVDLASGMETNIFPTKRTSEVLGDLFSDRAGKIDISPDRQRTIITFSDESRAIEVSLSDGKVLSTFASLHDASGLAQLPEERNTKAAKFRLYGVDYNEKHSRGGSE